MRLPMHTTGFGSPYVGKLQGTGLLGSNAVLLTHLLTAIWCVLKEDFHPAIDAELFGPVAPASHRSGRRTTDLFLDSLACDSPAPEARRTSRLARQGLAQVLRGPRYHHPCRLRPRITHSLFPLRVMWVLRVSSASGIHGMAVNLPNRWSKSASRRRCSRWDAHACGTRVIGKKPTADGTPVDRWLNSNQCVS